MEGNTVYEVILRLFFKISLKSANMSFNGFKFYICIDGSFIYGNDMAGWGDVNYDFNKYVYLINCGSFS